MPSLVRFHRVVLAAFFLSSSGAFAADSVHYRLDPVHTRVMFAIDHAGFSKAIGTVSGSTGSLSFDPEHWSDAALRASVPIARMDLGDAVWNKAVLAGNLLDADDHPTAEFVSTRVEPLTADHAYVHGTLTLHGISREVVLDVKFNAAKRHPLPPFRRTVGFSATTTLSRKAFGIDAWPSVIGDMVELRIEAEATRARADDEPDATDAPEGASYPTDAASAGAAPTTTTEPAP